MILEARDIYYRYKTSKEPVINGFSMRVRSGEMVGLCAPSGYGKSTLGRILAGYVKPDRGSVTIDGKPLPEKGYCPVQLLIQHPERAINPKWKLRRLLQEAEGESVDVLMDKLGIVKEWLDRYPGELSGGELQRFCLLRALQKSTKFLIADEMSAMLDAITQAQMWTVVMDYAKENDMGVVVISHEKPLIKRLCHEIFSLDQDQR